MSMFGSSRDLNMKSPDGHSKFPSLPRVVKTLISPHHSSTASDDGEDFIKASFMLKRSQMKKWYTKENYKNRWFRLQPEVLTYHDGNSESGWLKEKGRIYLRNIMMVEAVDDEALGTINTFQVEYKDEVDQHTLYIIANYAAERDQWVDTLKTVCQRLGVKFARYYHPGAWIQKLGQYTCCNRISRIAKGCKAYASTHANYDDSPSERRSSSNGSSDGNSNCSDSLGSQGGPLRKCVALYNYDQAEKGDLTLRKGSEYTILDDRFQHWWKVRAKDGDTGYIPANYVQVVTRDGLENYGWYYSEITRHECEHLLHENGWDGCFLLRHSRNPGTFTLSVFNKDKDAPEGVVRHYLVNVDPAGKYYFSEHFKFATIPDLISYHKYNLVGLATRLRAPPHQTSESSQGEETFLKQSKWHIDYSTLDFRDQLGSGEFGAVYMGLWRGTFPVAIKSMKNDAMSKDDFLLEAETMMQLQHNHLVKLYGVSVTDTAIYIVAEYMKKGSLLNYLIDYRERLFTSPNTLLDMCVQVCHGMCYLECQGFIHRDVAARNCLVGDRNVIKVGDFGLARFVQDQVYLSNAKSKIPIRWTAPEVLNTCQFSSKSDVWSFGVLMWEIYSGGKPPYGRSRKNVDVYNMIVQNQGRLEKPSVCHKNVYEIMYSCWAHLPENRPDFSQLLSSLELLQDTLPQRS